MDTPERLRDRLVAQRPTAALTVERDALVVPREHLREVARSLRDDPELQMDYLSSVTATDYRTFLEIVYHLYSMALKHGPAVLKVRVAPQDPHVPSLTPLYRGAEFQEREAYDLLGVIFDEHPDLRRILMWEEFQHHPLRKDYVQEDQDVLE